MLILWSDIRLNPKHRRALVVTSLERDAKVCDYELIWPVPGGE